ncbi:universal stress protein [Shinella sp.]|uniref:universal stress protein n=1 Tax=Shinella sp. TaxID=1870904 RepID=UPI003F71A948
MIAKRKSTAEGHRRKFLVVVDESPECSRALLFAGRRALHTGGAVVLLYVIVPSEFTQWVGVENIMRAEATEEAEKALVVERRRFARRLWKVGRQIRYAIAPERRQALPMMRVEATENSVTRTLSSRPTADLPGVSAARAKPSAKKPGGRDSNTWSR